MKRNKRHRHRHYIPGRDEDAATLAARLAPPEEKGQQAADAQAGARKNGGTIVVDTGALNPPEGFVKKAQTRRPLGLEPVVVVIVALALAFVAFVAWRITKMPPAAGDPAPNSIEQGRPSPAPGG
ncbi:MAG: hypothetical protein LC800_22840 [Acidobacteria bacterium]|nr:hypothetical protein [Acidobacteriota bacterium]